MKGVSFIAKKKESFRTYGVFSEVHTPLLVFQANTLSHISRRYYITKADFIVLAAGHMIQSDSLLKYFDSPSLLTAVNGVSNNAIFRSIKRLLRRGLIDVKERKKRLRRFMVTDKGLACIQSYIQWYNYTLALYNDSVHATN
jgi:hypothetical protein